MDPSLFAIFVFVAFAAILGGLAALVGEDSRPGFAPYAAGV
jgi:hypothetical protein